MILVAAARSLARLCFLVAALGACRTRESTSARGVVVRDSAGVEIVEHTADAIAALPEWTIDTVPLAQLVGDSGDGGFSIIRDVLQRRDGRWVVSDTRQRDIREYAPAGTFSRVLMGAGRGPGEVGFLERLWLLDGDSLAYVDANNRRLTVLAPDGRFARQFAYPRFEDGTGVRLLAPLADGRVLGTMRTPFAPTAEYADSVYRKLFAVVAFRVPAASDTNAPPRADTIAVVPDGEAYAATTTERGETFPDEYPLRFGRSTYVGTDGRRIFIGRNEQHEIVEYAGAQVVRRIRNGAAAAPFTNADRERFVAEMLSGIAQGGRAPSDVADLRRNILSWKYASTFSFHGRLTVGLDGTLWAEHPWLLPADARRYTAYDANGRALARAQFPERIVPLRFSAQEVLGTQLDDDDVPRVRRWRIVPRPPTP